MEAPGNRQHRRFVVIVHRHEHGAFEREAPLHGNLRFGERHAEAVGQAHRLPGGPHFWPQHGIYAGQFGEGEDRLLDRHPGDGKLIGEAQIVQGPPGDHGRRELGEGYPGGFADERHRP